MFNPFKKSFKPIEEYENTWGIAQAELNGKPAFLRFRNGMKEAVGHPGYGSQIGIATPLLEPTDMGLTNSEESQRLGEIEDNLEKGLTSSDEVVFVLVITYNSMREFVFYASEWKPEYFEQKVKDINKSFPEHDLQFMMQQDQKWSTFKKFVK